ncbi:hypothetical protein GCM10027345_39280 [Hymenobacter daeguensis]
MVELAERGVAVVRRVVVVFLAGVVWAVALATVASRSRAEKAERNNIRRRGKKWEKADNASTGAFPAYAKRAE